MKKNTWLWLGLGALGLYAISRQSSAGFSSDSGIPSAMPSVVDARKTIYVYPQQNAQVVEDAKGNLQYIGEGNLANVSNPPQGTHNVSYAPSVPSQKVGQVLNVITKADVTKTNQQLTILAQQGSLSGGFSALAKARGFNF